MKPPVKMKPTRAWAMVDNRGGLQVALRHKIYALLYGERWVRVEIREVEAKKRGRKT